MRLFVMVSFWYGAAVFVVRTILMASSEWPKPQKPKTLGQMVAATLLGLGVTVWAGLVLWAM